MLRAVRSRVERVRDWAQRRLPQLPSITEADLERSPSRPAQHRIFDEFTAFAGPLPGADAPAQSVDFIGAVTRASFLPDLPVADAASASLPPLPGFDEEYFEWVDILEAVHEASDRFTMLELGAGFGRWSVRAALAARAKGIEDIRLGLVEAEPAHASWIADHMRDNGIAEDRYRLYEYALGEESGTTLFYVKMPEGSEQNTPRDWYG